MQLENRRVLVLGARVLAAVAGVAASASVVLAQGPVFSNQTASSGLVANYARDLSSDPNVMVAGGAVGDFNNDGWQDVFVLGGSSAPDRLYINNGNGTFTEQAAAWGVARVHRGMGVAVGDVDGDGWLDIYVTCDPIPGGVVTNVLYRNNHNGTFTDIAPTRGVDRIPGLATGGGWGAAFGDYDRDGKLDLVISDWFIDGNRVLRQSASGAFVDVTASVLPTGAFASVQGFSPRMVDINADGRPDLLWTSDFGHSRLFLNTPTGFTNITTSAGVGLDGNGMGTAIGDFNRDGRPDWFVTSIYTLNPTPFQPGTGNMLYMNAGNAVFTETSAQAGVKQGGWGWGAVAVDLDNDGWEDIAHTNGWDEPEFANDLTHVFRNLGNGTFASVSPSCGVTHTGQGRGMLRFDYNNDGRQDLLVFANDGTATLYRNDTQGGNHWLRVYLRTAGTPGLAGNGYGSVVSITADGATQTRWICGGSNFQSQDELSAHFGLGSLTTIPELRVRWADGSERVWTNVNADQTLVLAPCRADYNGAGGVTVQDVFDFLTAWFGGQASADVNRDGATSVQDVFDFLSLWFAGCS